MVLSGANDLEDTGSSGDWACIYGVLSVGPAFVNSLCQ